MTACSKMVGVRTHTRVLHLYMVIQYIVTVYLMHFEGPIYTVVTETIAHCVYVFKKAYNFCV